MVFLMMLKILGCHSIKSVQRGAHNCWPETTVLALNSIPDHHNASTKGKQLFGRERERCQLGKYNSTCVEGDCPSQLLQYNWHLNPAA